MSDYQAISAAIRSYVAGDGHGWNDELPDIAAAYAALCRTANERLSRCADYLARGMRSEALHLADCQPQLHSLVVALDLPERKQWAAVCTSHNLPAAPALVTQPIELLRSAASQERALESLLSRHRVLAIAKAPLRDRLSVLALLAREDPQNPAWPQQIATLERSRLQEIRAELTRAIRAADFARVEELQTEIEDRHWQEPIPDDILGLGENAAQTLQAARNAGVVNDLQALASEVAAAVAAPQRDGAAIDRLLVRWDALIGVDGLTVPEDLLAVVRPALAWHAQEQARRLEQNEVKAFDGIPESRDIERDPEMLPAKPSRRSRFVWCVLLTAAAAAAAGVAYCVQHPNVVKHYLHR